ncbi:MAG: histidinol-phosphatase [candidate division Zixibacteria bacterium]|nr:histidinol-phosphatase [candidate division Zixibacteria bacterium]
MTKGLEDYHVHPDYSMDAQGSIEEYCQKALEIGLSEICFTPHYDTDPARKELDAYMRVDGKPVKLTDEVVKRYIDEVHKTKDKYSASGLSVKVGLEVDYAVHIEEDLRKKLPQFGLDFCLGAVHCLEHIAITSTHESEKYFRGKTAQQVCQEYFTVFRNAVSSGLFKTMAHLDSYKIYGIKFCGEAILIAHQGLVEPILELMAQKGVGLEINTGSFRKGHKETSPGIDILKMASHFGVKVNTIGSDAHKIQDLGKDLDIAQNLLQTIFKPTEYIKRKI